MQITDEQVIATLKEVVAEQPNYVYAAPEHMTSGTECFYVHMDADGSNQRPGCVVGHVLSRLGISLDELGEHEDAPAGAVVTRLVDGLNVVTEDLLQDVQTSQDGGNSWSEALTSALENAGVAA